MNARNEYRDLPDSDMDRVSFMDGQRVYLEFGKTGTPGSGYIYRVEDGWLMARWNGKSYIECSDFSTFRQALDAFMEVAADEARFPDVPKLSQLNAPTMMPR